MTVSSQFPSHFLVDDIVINAGTREVRRGNDVLQLPGLTLDLLLALVRAAPEMLSHAELEQQVWNGRSVSPETLTQRVKLVRDALGDATESPRYIAVVRGRGYRLIAPVKIFEDEPYRRRGRLAVFLSATTLVIALVLLITFTGRQQSIDINPVLTPELPSLAVLSFDDLSENEDQEHFSNGMSETLIRELAQVTGLKVIAKTSSFYFRDREVSISDIASELRVSHILEGSVQKVGNRVRVTAQLIDVLDSSSLWSEHFDRDLVDVFALQDEIARKVVIALRVTLLDPEEHRLAQRYRPAIEAYEQLILGQHEFERDTASSMVAAERHFLQAIEIDPGYALAYVSLANTYKFQVKASGRSMTDSIARRQALLETALDLDPFSAEAYAARAFLHRDRGHFELAEGDFLKAIELNPNHAMARQWYSALLRRLGRYEEALAQIQVAAELDPLAPYVQSTFASVLWDLGRVEEALAVLYQGIDQHPELPTFYLGMARHHTAMGNEGEAQWWNDEVLKLNPLGPNSLMWRCIGFLNLGDAVSAEICADQLHNAYPELLQTFYVRYSLQEYRGEHDAAIATLEAILERSPREAAFITTMFLANLVARQGDIERARRLMADLMPEFLEDEVELVAPNLGLALTFAAIFNANGETERRDVLLIAMEEKIRTMPRIRGYGYGILDVYIHAMRGDRELAVASLREAIDLGWKVTNHIPEITWWQLRSDWRLASLHNLPEFINLMNELEADIAAQRQWYEKLKGSESDARVKLRKRGQSPLSLNNGL